MTKIEPLSKSEMRRRGRSTMLMVDLYMYIGKVLALPASTPIYVLHNSQRLAVKAAYVHTDEPVLILEAELP